MFIKTMIRIITSILVCLLAACDGGSSALSQAPQNTVDAPAVLPHDVRSVVFEGDSLTQLSASTTWPNVIVQQSTWANTDWLDAAVGGTTTVEMLERYGINVHPRRPGIAGNGVFLINGGTNDLRYGVGTDASTYASLKQLWAKARADGFRVLAFTVHSARNAAPSVCDCVSEPYRISLNALIRSTPGLYDGLVEMDKLFPNLDDTALLSDKVHFTPAGNALVAIAVQNALLNLPLN